MTVKELKEKLVDMPDNAIVVVYDTAEESDCVPNGIELTTKEQYLNKNYFKSDSWFYDDDDMETKIVSFSYQYK